jgi:hypothetical protein
MQAHKKTRKASIARRSASILYGQPVRLGRGRCVINPELAFFTQRRGLVEKVVNKYRCREGGKHLKSRACPARA